MGEASRPACGVTGAPDLVSSALGGPPVPPSSCLAASASASHAFLLLPPTLICLLQTLEGSESHWFCVVPIVPFGESTQARVAWLLSHHGCSHCADSMLVVMGGKEILEPPISKDYPGTQSRRESVSAGVSPSRGLFVGSHRE